MSGRGALALCAVLALSACRETFFLALPEGTDWVTLVQEVDGQIPPSRLVRAEHAPLELPGAGEGRLTVLGYDHDTLSAALSGVRPDELSAAVVRGLKDCETPLPRAGWARALDEAGAFEALSPELVPAITSSIYDERTCQNGQVLGEVVCGIEGMDCAVEFIHGDACGYQVRSCSSVGLEAQAVLRADARLCAPVAPSGCRFDPAVGEWGGFVCTSDAGSVCEVRAHPRPPAKMALSRRISILEAPPKLPAAAADVRLESYHRFVEGQGYASGFAVLADRLVVATYAGAYEERSACVSDATSELRAFDRDTGALLGVKAMSGCVAALEATADGRGLLALEFQETGARRPLELVLLDAEGSERHRQRVEIPFGEEKVWGGSWLSRVEDEVFVASLSQSAGGGTGERSFLVRVRVNVALGTLVVEPPREYAGVPDHRHRHLTAAVVQGPHLALPDTANPAGVVWLDRSTLEVVHEWFADGALNLGRRPYFAVVTESGELLANALGTTPGTFVFEGLELKRSAREYEVDRALPLAMARWPANSRYVLSTSYVDAAHAVLFDTRNRNYVPGILPLGFGLPREARVDGDTVWVLLPWEPSLVQIAPVR